MAFKTNNFHATKHVPDDILMFGPPHCVNTRPNEMHHKKDKQSAKMTQKRAGCFDFQCVCQVENRRIFEYATEELNGRRKWDYYNEFQGNTEGPSKEAQRKPILSGVRSYFWYSEDDDRYTYRVFSKMKHKRRHQFTQKIVGVAGDLAEELSEYCPGLTVHSELHLPSGQKYRASPYFQGKPWYDWVMCRVGEVIDGFQQLIVPAQVLCFVDLTALPPENTTRFSPGIYMIVEPTRLVPEPREIAMSDLFVPYTKQEGRFGCNRMEILPIDNIIGPAAVIPDMSNKNKKAYLRLRPMCEWAGLFEQWINTEHLKPHEEPEIGG